MSTFCNHDMFTYRRSDVSPVFPHWRTVAESFALGYACKYVAQFSISFFYVYVYSFSLFMYAFTRFSPNCLCMCLLAFILSVYLCVYSLSSVCSLTSFSLVTNVFYSLPSRYLHVCVYSLSLSLSLYAFTRFLPRCLCLCLPSCAPLSLFPYVSTRFLLVFFSYVFTSVLLVVCVYLLASFLLFPSTFLLASFALFT